MRRENRRPGLLLAALLALALVGSARASAHGWGGHHDGGWHGWRGGHAGWYGRGWRGGGFGWRGHYRPIYGWRGWGRPGPIGVGWWGGGPYWGWNGYGWWGAPRVFASYGPVAAYPPPPPSVAYGPPPPIAVGPPLHRTARRVTPRPPHLAEGPPPINLLPSTEVLIAAAAPPPIVVLPPPVTIVEAAPPPVIFVGPPELALAIVPPILAVAAIAPGWHGGYANDDFDRVFYRGPVWHGERRQFGTAVFAGARGRPPERFARASAWGHGWAGTRRGPRFDDRHVGSPGSAGGWREARHVEGFAGGDRGWGGHGWGGRDGGSRGWGHGRD